MKLEVIAAEFLQDKKVYCAPKTIESYSDHVNRFLQSDEVPEDLENLTKSILRKYVLQMREEGIRSVTIQTYMRSVKVFCKWLYNEGYLDEDISKGLKLPKEDPKMKIPLTEDEVKRIDEALPLTRDRIIFHLMIDAGLRVSEVCNLKRDDIDFENNYIRIRNSKNNRNRVVPLCARLKNWTRYHYSGTEYLLAAKNGEKLSDNAVKQVFHGLKKKAAVPRLHCHLCRHTFATSYIMGGGNMEMLRMMMGHTDYNTTKIYLQMAAEYSIVKYPIYKLDPVFFERGY